MARKGKKTKRKPRGPLGPEVGAESGASAGNDILTVDQAATYLRVARSTLYKLVRRGAVPCMKVGGAVRFSRRTLLGWVESESMKNMLGAEDKED